MSNGAIVSSVIDLIESRRDDAAPHSCGGVCIGKIGR